MLKCNVLRSRKQRSEAYFVLIRLLVRVSIILLQKDFIVRYCIMNMEEPHQLLFLYPTGLTENE